MLGLLHREIGTAKCTLEPEAVELHLTLDLRPVVLLVALARVALRDHCREMKCSLGSTGVPLPPLLSVTVR